MKNSLQYATDDKEKRNSLQFIDRNENQIVYGKSGEQSERSFNSNNRNMDMNIDSHVNEESEFKDNFD